jgi:hypothetical protein
MRLANKGAVVTGSGRVTANGKPGARETMPRKVTAAADSPLTFTVGGPTTAAVIDVPAALFNEKKAKPRGPDEP